MSALKAHRQISPAEAQARLEELCARAERCTDELRRKLVTWQIAPAEAEAIIRTLQQTRFVDNARFARAFVRDKVRFDRRGRRWLRQALMAKRISATDIAAAFDEIDPDLYQQNLEASLRGRLQRDPQLSQTFEGRTKLFRYALTRGYEPDLTAHTLRTLLKGL